MGEIEREIEVRSLTGESTMISISPDKTFQDLKLVLKQSFALASFSPRFHLFLKGVKLNLQSQISSHPIEPGDFIVIIPYTKKDKTLTKQQYGTTISSIESNKCATTVFSDSAWSDMMQDLSSLRENENANDQASIESYSTKGERTDGNAKTSTNNIHEKACKRKIDGNEHEMFSDDLTLSILLSPGNNIFEGRNGEKFMQVLELVNCLYDTPSRECLLLREAKSQESAGTLYTENAISCLCPPWLNKIMKAFAFLNILYAFVQLRSEEVTWTLLRGALDQLGKCGLQVDIEDLDQLLVLCPTVVRNASNTMEGTPVGNAIVIVDCSTDKVVNHNPQKAQKQTLISNFVNGLKIRENSFKSNLWEIVRLSMRKNGMSVSLDDVLTSVKERSTRAKGNKLKRAKTNSASSSSSSRSSQAQCNVDEGDDRQPMYLSSMQHADHPSNFPNFEKSHINDTKLLSPSEMVDHLRKGIGSDGQIVHVEEISARRAIYVEVPQELSEISKSALKRIEVDMMYSHQAESIQASLAGKNVVVATLTSSGKSLCYNLPVLEVLSQDSLACALYLFPTKALAQDQLRALLAMTEEFEDSLNVGVYDGDTSPENRACLRDQARLLITNPDMLHVSILPYHGQFSRILSNLRFVVIDETHAYKGAFGCHTALILRRLRRLCSHVYGSNPSFVCCTATSANPREHAMELANLQTLELIQNDGSPSGEKIFILWNPTLCLKTVPTKFQRNINKTTDEKVLVKRSSPIFEVSRLFAELVQHGLRSIAFCKSRKLCELVLCYTREILQETAPHLVDSICAYRSGYIAEDRRRIEGDFFGGKISGIAATNALELGIDVGHIDATLHLGFPGSMASLWQQAGRSGRRERPSLAVYVAFEGPLDQYFMKSPQKLFRSPIECCHIDAQNPQVLQQHLACAAFEHPLSQCYDEKYFGPSLSAAIFSLKNKGDLTFDPSRNVSARVWTYTGHEIPSRAVSIRSIETEKYKVIDQRRNEVIEEIEESKAFFQVYEGAVYMNQGKTYLVKELDISSKIAICQEADLKYYTTTRDYTDIHVIGGDIAYPPMVVKSQLSRTSAHVQTCTVKTTWFGFRRIQKGSNKILDTVDLSLPPFSYESQAVWIRVPQSTKTAVEIRKLSFRAGLHAACHAILNVVPLYLVCNLSDLAPECANPHDSRYFPERILLYDQHPGGSGVSAQVKPFFTELLTAALELLTSCHCVADTGCPNCVQSFACHEYNGVLHKDAAIMIIEGVLQSEKVHFEELNNHA